VIRALHLQRYLGDRYQDQAIERCHDQIQCSFRKSEVGINLKFKIRPIVGEASEYHRPNGVRSSIGSKYTEYWKVALNVPSKLEHLESNFI